MLKRVLLLSLLLVSAWLLWSGLYKPLLLGLGAFSCLLVLDVVRRMGFFDSDVFALRYNFRLIGYWAWLVREIVRSTIEVARTVLTPNMKVTPKVVEIAARDLDRLDQTLLGNSITLTPGTLTLDVHEGRILVHALSAEGAEELLAGEMKRRVADLRRN